MTRYQGQEAKSVGVGVFFSGEWAVRSVRHFVCAMAIPCAVVAYLLIKKNDVADLSSWYAALREADPQTTSLLKSLTDWGNFVFYPVYVVILLLGCRLGRPGWRRFAWAYLVVQLLISFALVRLLKVGLGCPRPDVLGPCLPLSFDAGHNALPSGHTVEIVGAAMPLAMRAGFLPLTLLLGVFVGLMVYSRVFLGWHHPEDVAFGLAFGGYAAWLIHEYGR